MAYPGNFLRLVASGTYFDTEQFAWTLSLIPNFSSPTAGPEEVPQAVIDAVTAFHGSGSIANSARLTTLKLNLIGPDGRYVDDGDTVLHDFAPPGLPGGGQPRHAPQVALAVSLQTARTRGRAHAGRFYVPSPTYPIDSTGRISAADAEVMVGNASTLIESLNAALPEFIVGVASDVGTGRFQAVTNVRVGRVLDTIRSRRSSLPEEYVVGEPVAT